MHSSSEMNTIRHEYPLTGSRKVTHLIYAAMFLIGAGFFFRLAIDPVGREFPLVVGVLFLVPGLIMVSLAVRSRLILDGDDIELRSALRTHAANRSEIEGLRTIENQYGRWIRICLSEGRGAFNVSDSFTGKDDFREWLKGLPDLDELDAAQITQQIRIQDSLGTTSSKGLSALKLAKAWMIGLSIIGGLGFVLVLVNYAPFYAPSIVLLALLPPLGVLIVHRFPLLFTIFKRKADPRIDVGLIVLFPGIGMAMASKTGSDPTHLVDFSQLAYWALLVLVFYVAALFRIVWENPSRLGAFVGLLIFGGMYSFGLSNCINTLPDRSVPRLYRTHVVQMHETQGRNASSYLRLAPWGPMDYSDDVSVPKRIYLQVKVGDQICVGLHPGFLHASWYALAPCAQQMDASAPPPQ